MIISAPGKLMLFGEHAAVYGYPCITTAVDTRLTVTIESRDDDKIVLDAPEVKDTRFVDAAIAYARHTWPIQQKGFHLTTTCPFSGCYGFGSSSAVTVAVLQAIASLHHVDLSKRALFDAAYTIVLSIQGAASGFDVASAVFGETLYFVKAGKVIEPISAADMPLIVGYTGVKADTKALISDVSKKREKEPDKLERIFAAIGKIVGEAKTQIIEGDWERVGRLMDFNQEYLRDLGVSSEKLEALIQAAKAAGAWGAKLSGAGGGDCMIALAPKEKRQAVEEALKQAGGEVVAVRPNAPGVCTETTDNQQELFVVVDKNDTILGYKTRYECHHDKTLIHRVVGALLFNDEGKILLQKRSVTKDMEPGLWGISAAGHVTRGQTDDEAVHRELQEELGIDAPLTFWKKFISEESNETERDVVYKGVFNGPFHPNSEEVSDLRFFEIRELKLFLASRRIKLTQGATKTLHEVGIL